VHRIWLSDAHFLRLRGADFRAHGLTVWVVIDVYFNSADCISGSIVLNDWMIVNKKQ
jgi:hypothetical protein